MILDQAKDAVTCVRMGKGGDAIVTSSVDGKIRTFDLRTAQMITEDIVHPVTSFSFSNDGTSIAASCLDGIVRLWESNTAATATRTTSRKRVFQKLYSAHKSNNYKVECAFTSNDEYLISGSECGAVAIYPVNSNGNNMDATAMVNANATTLKRHAGPTCSVAACPRTSRPWLIVSASYDGSAIVWASQSQHDCCLFE